MEHLGRDVGGNNQAGRAHGSAQGGSSSSGATRCVENDTASGRAQVGYGAFVRRLIIGEALFPSCGSRPEERPGRRMRIVTTHPATLPAARHRAAPLQGRSQGGMPRPLSQARAARATSASVLRSAWSLPSIQ